MVKQKFSLFEELETNIQAIEIVCLVNEQLIPDVFEHACQKGHTEIVEFLTNNASINNACINTGFILAYQKN